MMNLIYVASAICFLFGISFGVYGFKSYRYSLTSYKPVGYISFYVLGAIFLFIALILFIVQKILHH